MSFLSQESLLQIIQLAVTPMIMIAGLGGLLITMTNRMARIVDRTRSLAAQVEADVAEGDRVHHVQQLRIMFRRAKLIRSAVTLTSTSIFCAALLVIVLFVGALFQADLAVAIVAIFAAGVGFLVFGLIAFIRDIFASLAALQLVVEKALQKTAPAATPVPVKVES